MQTVLQIQSLNFQMTSQIDCAMSFGKGLFYDKFSLNPILRFTLPQIFSITKGTN